MIHSGRSCSGIKEGLFLVSKGLRCATASLKATSLDGTMMGCRLSGDVNPPPSLCCSGHNSQDQRREGSTLADVPLKQLSNWDAADAKRHIFQTGGAAFNPFFSFIVSQLEKSQLFRLLFENDISVCVTWCRDQANVFEKR